MPRISRSIRSLVFAVFAVFVSFSASAADLPGDEAIAQLDRAEALIAQQDASGRSAFALLGLLTDADRALLSAAITEAAELTDAASVAVDRSIETIDAMTDRDDAMIARRFALAVERRELRLPLARARAASILAALQNDARTKTALATTAVNALHKVTLNGVAIDTRGAVIAGEALLLLEQPAKALASFDTVLERAGQASENDRPSPIDVAEAMVGRAIAIGQVEGDHAARFAFSDCHKNAPFVAHGVTSPLLALLRADAGVRLDQASGTSVEIDGYLEAMKASGSEAVYRVLREAVFGRIELLWSLETWTPASAPPLAQVVRSGSLALDESTKTGAIRTLERLLEQPTDAGSIALDEARVALALIEAPTNPRRAMLLLLEIDEESMAAPGALREAYRIGDQRTHTDPADPETAVFDRVIATLIERSADKKQRDALWFKRAAIFEQIGADEKAIAAYDSIPGDSPVYLRAQQRAVSLSVRAMLSDGSAAQAASLLDRAEALDGVPVNDAMGELLFGSRVLALTALGRMEEAVSVIDAQAVSGSGPASLTALAIDGCLAPLEQRILDAELRGDAGAQHTAADLLLKLVRSDRAQAMAPTRDRRRAEGLALLYADRPDEALPVFQHLIEERFDFRLNTWRAEAHHANEQPEAAFGLYRSVAEILESKGKTADPDFWRCWARMLEILVEQGEETRNDEGIRVQINRLRLYDQAFGGEPFKRWIAESERTIKPTGE